MKIADKSGMFWAEESNNNQIFIGITPKMMKKIGCVHVYIPHLHLNRNISQGELVASIESNKTLIGLKSPTAGTVSFINEQIPNAPFELNNYTPLFKVINPNWKEDFPQ